MGLIHDTKSNVLTTTVEAAVNWGRKNSLWPMPFGTACCGIELMAALASRSDIARFGAEAIRFSTQAVRSSCCCRTDYYQNDAGFATHLRTNAGA